MRLRQVLLLSTSVLLASGLLAWAAQQITAPNPPNGDDSNRIATTHWVQNNGGGGGGAVSSVFTRTGAVVSAAGDYAASQVNNDSSTVTGTHVSDALDSLKTLTGAAALKANNLSDLSSPATALTTLGGVSTARTITAGTGLSGGGDLSANRTVSLSTQSNNTVLANNTGGVAVPTGLTASNVLDMISSTQGTILYRDSGNWAALGTGTNGQVLTTAGPSANPSWTSAGTGTVTSVATGTGLTGGPVTTTGTVSLATVADKSILANVSGGVAAPSANTLSAIIDSAISSTQGTVLYRGASAWSALATGTDGSVLTTHGAAADPTWTAAPSGNVPVGGSTGQVLAKASATNYDTTWQTVAGTGTVVGPGSSTDNAMVRFDGTAGTGIQNSGVIVDDSNNITGVASVVINNTGLNVKDVGGSFKLSIIPGSTLSADRNLTITTGDAARTVTLSGDTTLSGTNTGDQTITLTGDVTGTGTGSFATTIANNAVGSAKLSDTPLKAIAGVSPAADRVPYFDSSSTAALATFTSAGRNLVGGADAAAQRTTLGLGTSATVNTGTSGATIPLLNGNNTFSGTTTWTGSLIVPIRVITAAGAITVSGTTDYFICVNKTVGAATTVNLPSSPATGATFLVKDCKGDAATNNITITPATGNIDGASTYVISTNRNSVAVTYDGTQWEVN